MWEEVRSESAVESVGAHAECDTENRETAFGKMRHVLPAGMWGCYGR